jgi:hypothetical protein
MAVVATLNITGAVTDTDGNTAPFTATANQSGTDLVTISSVNVSPDPAVAGTLRTLTVVAVSSLGETLTATVSATGVTFTPVTGQPAGTFVWTFTY